MAHLLRYPIWEDPATPAEIDFMGELFDFDAAALDEEGAARLSLPVSTVAPPSGGHREARQHRQWEKAAEGYDIGSPNQGEDFLEVQQGVGQQTSNDSEQQSERVSHQENQQGVGQQTSNDKEQQSESVSNEEEQSSGSESPAHENPFDKIFLVPEAKASPPMTPRLLQKRPRRPRSSIFEEDDIDTTDLNGMSVSDMASEQPVEDAMAGLFGSNLQTMHDDSQLDIEKISDADILGTAQVQGAGEIAPVSTPEEEVSTPPNVPIAPSDSNNQTAETFSASTPPHPAAPASPVVFITPKTGVTHGPHDRNRTTQSTPGADSLKHEMRQEEDSDDLDELPPIPMKELKKAQDSVMPSAEKKKKEASPTVLSGASSGSEGEPCDVEKPSSPSSPPPKRQRTVAGKQPRRQTLPATNHTSPTASEEQLPHEPVGAATATTTATTRGKKKQPQQRKMTRSKQSDVSAPSGDNDDSTAVNPKSASKRKRSSMTKELQNLSGALGVDRDKSPSSEAENPGPSKQKPATKAAHPAKPKKRTSEVESLQGSLGVERHLADNASSIAATVANRRRESVWSESPDPEDAAKVLKKKQSAGATKKAKQQIKQEGGQEETEEQKKQRQHEHKMKRQTERRREKKQAEAEASDVPKVGPAGGRSGMIEQRKRMYEEKLRQQY